MAPKFRFDHPDRALEALAEKLATVQGIERSTNLVGRILASAVVADRDSPAADVSAMDGYAIRLSERQTTQPIAVTAESAPGGPPPSLELNSAVRIFTGAIVPPEADLVIKREDTDESELNIRLRESAMQCQAGEHIRRTGENATAGSIVLNSGIRLTAAHRATMANFGCDEADVYAPVTTSIITTGDEVGVQAGTTPKPWQLRDSNRASLSALLDPIPWAKLHAVDHADDQQNTLRSVLENHLEKSDAVLLTGGVSMGNYDYVPDVIRDLGGEIVFHGLPIRPGKPVLGAATKDGKLIFGLPGNPVSATVGCRRLAMPLLAKISGQTQWNPPCPVVGLKNPGDKTIPLHWLKLVQLSDAGLAEVVISQGSGDLVSLGQSSGFVEVASGQTGKGPWPYYSWEA
ncbi:MAG: molybdopterin molybdotransferase MoeA [Rubripirellula sp.]|nr:molybdopterin molybdotransferase MoeA [Rubripirellula sp.]